MMGHAAVGVNARDTGPRSKGGGEKGSVPRWRGLAPPADTPRAQRSRWGRPSQTAPAHGGERTASRGGGPWPRTCAGGGGGPRPYLRDEADVHLAGGDGRIGGDESGLSAHQLDDAHPLVPGLSLDRRRADGALRLFHRGDKAERLRAGGRWAATQGGGGWGGADWRTGGQADWRTGSTLSRCRMSLSIVFGTPTTAHS